MEEWEEREEREEWEENQMEERVTPQCGALKRYVYGGRCCALRAVH